MMDSDDDDIYPTNDPVNAQQGIKPEPDAEEEGEEADEDDSDEEINFIVDAKEEPKPETKAQPKRPTSTGRTTSEQPKRSLSPPNRRRASKSQSQDIKLEPQSPRSDKPGTEYPGRHTSKIDVNANPIHPTTGKSILSTDFDNDFPTESSKPWRKPGADITDYFNYGFDEFTWASYCLKQQQMPKQVKEINQEAEQMKAFVEGIPGGGMPGMPGAPTGPGGGGGAAAGGGGMPGMPSEVEMQQMFSSMMAQGMDPSQMDQNQFMQMMMGGGGGMMGGNQPPSGPGGGFGGGGGFDQGGGFGDGGGGGGRGRGRGRRGRGW